MDYTPSQKKKRLMLDEEECDDPAPITIRDPISSAEIEDFISSINDVLPSAAIFRVVEPYADQFAPPPVDLPPLFCDLFDPSHCHLPLQGLIEMSKNILESGKYNVTISQVGFIEKRTRKQSKSVLWKKIRAGLATASSMYALCHTNPDNPSKTVLKMFCYLFEKSKATNVPEQ